MGESIWTECGVGWEEAKVNVDKPDRRHFVGQPRDGGRLVYRVVNKRYRKRNRFQSLYKR